MRLFYLLLIFFFFLVPHTYAQTASTRDNADTLSGGVLWGQVFYYGEDSSVRPKDNVTLVLDEINGSFHTTSISGTDQSQEGDLALPGTYIMTGLPEGQYTLHYICPNISEVEYYEYITFEEPTEARIINIVMDERKNIDINIEIPCLYHTDTYVKKITGEVVLANHPLIDPNTINFYLWNISLEFHSLDPRIKMGNFPRDIDYNGHYEFTEKDRIRPGPYAIWATDQRRKFYIDKKEITLYPEKEYNIDFHLNPILPDIRGSISGYVYCDETKEPLPGVLIRALNVDVANGMYDSQTETITDAQGKYTINNLIQGEYIITTSPSGLIKVGTHSYSPEIYENIMWSNWNWASSEERIISIHRLETLGHTIDVGFTADKLKIDGVTLYLSDHTYSFSPGINLFGYPGEPPKALNSSFEICEGGIFTSEFGQGLDNSMESFTWYDALAKKWYRTLPDSKGEVINISNGNGYVIYMKNESGPQFLPPTRVVAPNFNLQEGQNFISYPDRYQGVKDSYDLIDALGAQQEVGSVHRYENKEGAWETTCYLWGRASGDKFKIKKPEAYVVYMKEEKSWTPGENGL
ncbi:MAG: hypothetical protein ACMUJM_11255 [bacterium]